MTIKWGDPIECNGVRPEWLRGRQPLSVDTGLPSSRWLYEEVDDVSSDAPVEDWAWSHSDGEPNILRFKLPAGHPAYVALARGFTPWSGGESAPDDWDGDRAPNILLRNGETRRSVSSWAWRENSSKAAHATDCDVIGYRKRAVHTDGTRSGGQPPSDTVEIKRMTEAEARQWIDDFAYSESSAHILHALEQLGVVQSRAERFTRETGYEVTEAVQAALNWNET